jgi:L-seryl-tRNA(Ser) seleniumtransferase
MNELMRTIPPVHELLAAPRLQSCIAQWGRACVVEHVRAYLEELRAKLRSGQPLPHGQSVPELAEVIAARVAAQERPALRRVINATGILLHTGLGRAPLAEEALQAVFEVSRGYSNLEIDLQTGTRSQRVLAVEPLLRRITGAEAATVVNNNAAATLLVLAALAAGREVIVSRGELIEIGGSFRLPDVMAQSGARLREIGTTNKTRLSDYEQAIGPHTAALLKVHTSNYRIVGFTEEVPIEELAVLARQHHLPLIHDIGSGALIDLAFLGIHDEPVAARSIQCGTDLILFSGDKLLGGPQCGIIVGRAVLVRQIAQHPLSRALRVDKMTLAALEATLRLYLDPARIADRLPLLKLLQASTEHLRQRAEQMASQLRTARVVEQVEVVADVTYLGGGSVPAHQIPTWCVAVTPRGRSVDVLARQLREATPAVVGRIAQNRFLLDLRSIFPAEDADVVAVLSALT